MIRRIKHYLKQGRPVKFMTARVFSGAPDRAIEEKKIWDWSEQYLGVRLPLTAEKDKSMITLFDDRTTQVIPNTGKLVQEELKKAIQALRTIATDNIEYTELSKIAQRTLASLDEWSRNLGS